VACNGLTDRTGSKRLPRRSTASAGRRWELTPAERETLRFVRRGSYSSREVLTLLIRSPRAVRETLAAMARGAVDAAATNASLVWVFDSNRIRQVVPDAASGVNWGGEDWFVQPLLPRLAAEMHVLDLGCGAGRISRIVAPRVARVACADVSRVLLAEAHRNLADLENVDFIRTNGHSLAPLQDTTFDLAFAQGVFSYLEPVACLGLLDEVKRVLRRKGTSIINFFTIDDVASAEAALRAARAVSRRGRPSGSSPRPFTKDQVIRMHTLVGLGIDEIIEPPPGTRESTLFVARPSSP
jgi:SAM-dependent methyltransferase